MGTLTIRTDTQEDAAIEELKALFGEASASKAILGAVMEFKVLAESDQENSRAALKYKNQLRDLKATFERLESCKKNIEMMMRNVE